MSQQFPLKPTINPYKKGGIEQLKAVAAKLGFGIQEEYNINDTIEFVSFLQNSKMDNKTYDNSYNCYKILQGRVVKCMIGKHTNKKIYSIHTNDGPNEELYNYFMRPLGE